MTNIRLITLACLLAAPATAQVNYGVWEFTAYVASSPNASGDVVIASTYNGYLVTSIADHAFYSCTNLTSVTFPNSVTNIGAWAFLGCSSLTNLAIGNSVTSIGNRAFWACTSLMSVTMPNSVTTIGEQAFSYCTNLASVTIPTSVTSLGDWAFQGCTSLTNITVAPDNPAYSSIGGVLFNEAQTLLIQFPGGRGGDYVIPTSVTSIRKLAFSTCTSLTKVTLGNSVTAIGDGAFYDCSNLISVAIGNSVTSIGEQAFSHCTSLTSVTIPDGVTDIGEAAFGSCTSLTNLTIGNGLTTIGHRAFVACTKLTSVMIPNSVTNVWSSAFGSCTSLTGFSVDAANSVYSSLNGVLFDKAQTTLILFPAGFGGSYVIPDSITSVGSYAFGGCTRLASVTIPDAATNIGYYAFELCTSLTNITVGTDNPAYSSIDGVLFDKAQTFLIQFPGGRGGDYVIPNGVTTIGRFFYCTSLTSVTIPESVTTLHYYSSGYPAFRPLPPFFGCNSLTSLTFLGNTPEVGYPFDQGAGVTVYYHYGTTGWKPTFLGFPTVMLSAPPSQIRSVSVEARPGGFGFSLGGVTNQTIVVEASTNLVNWQPIWTNTLSGTSTSFADPQWYKHPNRFYRGWSK